MLKRFRTRKKVSFKVIKILIIGFIIYASFSFVYTKLYKNYLDGLSNEEIIVEVTKNTKLSSFDMSKYTDPKNILKYTLNYEFKGDDERVLEVKEVANLDNNPIVYIYTTHEGEKYSDEILENYNIVPSVKTAEFILKDYLDDLGVSSYIENGSVSEILKSNNWSYNRSYDASRMLISKVINEYNSLKLIIDLHRDSSNLDKTLLEVEGVRYAKVMFVIGTEYDGYDNNYRLAKKFSDLINKEVDGLSRGVLKKGGVGVNGIYNQDISSRMVLMELGGQYNQIDDLNNTLEVISRVILELVSEKNEE